METLLVRPFRSLLTEQLELLVLARDAAGVHWIFDVVATSGGLCPPVAAQGVSGGPHDLYGALDAFDIAVALRQGLCSEPSETGLGYAESLATLLGPQSFSPLGRDHRGALVAPPEDWHAGESGGPGVHWLAERLPTRSTAGWLVAIPGGGARWHGPMPESLDALRHALRAPWAKIARERGTLIVEVRLESNGTVWLLDSVRMGHFGPERTLAERRLALGEIADSLGRGPLTLPEELRVSDGPRGRGGSIMLRRLDAPYDPRDPRALRVVT